MNYSELIQLYFERSTALQWYWTIYILVIGGVLGFSTLRQRPETATVILATILYACFAYKNLGAIEATAVERQAVLQVIKEYKPDGLDPSHVQRLRDALESKLPPYDVEGARHFHIACDLLTIAVFWAKEWQRRKMQSATATIAA